MSRVYVKGLNGAQAVGFSINVKHGAGTRRVEVQVELETILMLAKALECCPKVREGASWYPAHAVWHMERRMFEPCPPREA